MARHDPERNRLLYGEGLLGPITPPNRNTLNNNFDIAPFSVWNTREGWWQNQRQQWMKFGFQSELGRDGKLTFAIPDKLADGSKGNKIKAGTSVFDPVLCEIAYSWWSWPGAIVLDPFAGGCVRGLMASLLGRRYRGVELRPEQVAANKEQRTPERCGQYKPIWYCGDSYDLIGDYQGQPTLNDTADFLFSCPPYGNLEVYSDRDEDISNMPYGKFLKRYTQIIMNSCAVLADNSFACFVVANYRDKETGELIDLVGDTVRAFRKAGLKFWSENILVNSVGSGAMRCYGTFLRGNGKTVKVHQNILVFVKGDPDTAFAKIEPHLLKYTTLAKKQAE